MKLNEPFREEYLNKTTSVYHNFELSIVEAFDDFLKGLPGRQSARLVNVRYVYKKKKKNFKQKVPNQ